MSEYKKAIPIIDGDTKEFWEGCKRHELLIQRCKDCKQYRFYPRPICQECLSPNTEWVKVSGKGEIYSFTVFHHTFDPAWTEDVPYTVAVIQLEEGLRMVSNVIDCRPEGVKIGMKVEVVFEDITDEITLPKFKPVKEG